MNKKLINYWWRSGESYDSDFAAVMARWTALGYTHPSSTVLTSLNQFVLDLKTYGIWTGLDALWVFMLNDSGLVATTGTINYKSPSANAITWPVAPTYATSGFEGNGTTQYALTNFNPSTHGVQHTLNSSSRGALVYKAKTAAVSYLDGHVTSAFNVITGNTTGSTLQRVHGNSVGPSVVFDNTGYIAINRSGAANGEIYKETTRSTGTGASISLPNENYTILRSSSGYGDFGVGAYYLGRSFTQTEHGNFRTALLAHKTRLGL